MKNVAPLPGEPVRGSLTGRPIMALLDLLGRRGSLRILWMLRKDVLTFRQLSRAAELNPSTLNARLRELRAAGLVAPESGYRLTEAGFGLIAALKPLRAWAKDWAPPANG